MMKKLIFLLLLIGCFVPVVSFGQVDPQDVLRGRMNTPLLRAEGTLTGEGLCWHAAYEMDRFMDGYQETGDRAWLDAGMTYYDALLAKLHTSPDGYKGWVGPYIYDKDYICDVHVGDAILFTPMLDFCEVVLKNPDEAIVQAYRDKAETYLNLVKKHLFEKWDARQTWHEDGPYGAYTSWDHYLTADNLKEWKRLPATKSVLSLPFNKQNDMALAALRIFRITGEPWYRERALRIFAFMKSRMYMFEDCLLWNYWEPFGPWDIDTEKPNTLRHWVNVHPYRNYQAGEVGQIVEAYHSGLVFSEADIQGIINTNLKGMWNGDREKPTWRNSNYNVEVASLGQPSIAKAPGGDYPELAGTLWRALADFDPTIRALGKIKRDTPVSFARHHADLPVTEWTTPLSQTRWFIMAAMIPSQIQVGESASLVCSTRNGGPIEIHLCSADGQQVIQAIRTKPESERARSLLIHSWQAEGIEAGEYRIRWSREGESRDFPIQILASEE